MEGWTYGGPVAKSIWENTGAKKIPGKSFETGPPPSIHPSPIESLKNIFAKVHF